ncbi:uncharacterized protein DUF4123 [Paraburkholderia caballeronis]|uniref:DUF4123 domain-containing protein n=1 Tax=Paraburkholderia caballeronis TaxID=416943 RepID=UPI0010DB4543|nr:DUF4123 domain-containing protein [Paraburkholderia caballeronis]TDV26692.1 uncharacterized protein DUF4123 [Paraburkholderia caballeronis]
MIPASVNEHFRKYRSRSWAGCYLFALVDGIQYEQHTGRQLESLDDAAVSLFAGTREIALAYAGPWLVDPRKASDRIADLGELELARAGVIWLITSEKLERQAAKLRPYLDIALPNKKSALLRFWDPRVIHGLNEAYRSKEKRALFKTATEWQYLYEEQRFTINDHDQPH